VTLLPVIAFMVSLVFAPLAFSTNAANAGTAVCSKDSASETAGCMKCCSMHDCCAMEKNDAPAAPQPISNSSTSSSQQILDGLAFTSLPLLFEFPPQRTVARFSHDEFPHCSTSPLAQGCIQLI
jgi:hypothetical protein